LVLDGLISQGTALIVAKEKIAENGDYNLSGERYREGAATLSQFPHVALCDICEINPDTASPTELYPDSFFNYIDISCVENGSGNFLGANKVATAEAPSRARRAVKQEDVLVSTVRPNLKAFAILSEVPDRAIASTGFAVLRAKAERLISGFLIVMLRHEKSIDQMVGIMGKGAYPSINQSDVESIRIPLPPLEVQKEIVAEIEAYQKIINGARAVLDNYRPHISIHPDWPMEPLGVHFATKSGGTPLTTEPTYWTGDIPWVSPKDMKSDVIYDTQDHLSHIAISNSSTKLIPAHSVICVVRSGILKHTFPVALLSRDMCINQDIIAFAPLTNAITSQFLFYVLKTMSASILADGIKPGVTVQSFYNGFFKDYPVPVPSLETQQAIVSEIEAEQALVAANRELITRFEKKIQATLARVWGEEPELENSL
jgi:type I restriction enzyme M protein